MLFLMSIIVMNNKNDKQLDTSTEEKILAAAKKIFTEKGYAATKVRDIAAEADINLSLVNYYFRSKEKLFEVIMAENVNILFEKIGPVLNDEQTTLSDKLRFIAEYYINILLINPDFSKFIVNEVLSGSNKIPAVVSKRKLIKQSNYAKQVLSLQAEGKVKFHPLHILMNLMGLIIFPFLGRKLFGQIGISNDEFKEMMEERKQLIPGWIDDMIGS